MRKISALLSIMLLGGSVALAAGQSTSTNGSPNATPAHPPSHADNVAQPLVPPRTDNATLQSNIQQALRNESSLNGSQVSAQVTDNAIELSGNVASLKDKQAAERIAASFDGNRQLHDNLAVNGVAQTAVAPNRPAPSNAENTPHRLK